MKTLIFSAALIFLGFNLGYSQNSVEVQISNFDSDKGMAIIGLYNSQAQFLDVAYQSKKVKIKGSQVSVTFTDVPAGTYAISAIHDEDNDGEFDMFLGFYPKEDYATSNNAPGNFGPPKWKDAKFECENGKKVIQKIVMR